MGIRDPSMNLKNAAQLAFETPDGPTTVQATRHEQTLTIQCFGNGRHWVQPRLAALFGLLDQPQEFRPNGIVESLIRELPGVHLPTLPVLFHRLVQIVLQQLVSWNDALSGWCQMTRRFGSDAPGPSSLRLAPSAKLIKQLGYYDIVQCGVLPRQARLILRLAHEAKRIERLAEENPESLSKYLLTIPGVGDWTVQYLLGASCGVADAVMTGDYGLPHTVAWFLSGEERSNDEEMLQLLEPYRGHRFRVINLLWQSGITAPRRGPKMRTNRWRFETGKRR